MMNSAALFVYMALHSVHGPNEDPFPIVDVNKTFPKIVTFEIHHLNTNFLVFDTKYLVFDTKYLIFDAKLLVFDAKVLVFDTKCF